MSKADKELARVNPVLAQLMPYIRGEKKGGTHAQSRGRKKTVVPTIIQQGSDKPKSKS